MSTFFDASSSRWRDEVRLGERRLEVERALEADAGRNVLEELFDRGDADRREHLLAVGVGERELAHSLVCEELLVRVRVEQRVDLGGV